MSHQREINSIVEQVAPWPEEDRVALAYLILRAMRKMTRDPAPRDTLSQALGVARGKSDTPDDATVEAWISEHRLKKYG